MIFKEVFRFDEERETEFQRFYLKDERYGVRLTIVLGVALNIAFIVIDFFRVQEFSDVLIVRSVAIALLLLTYYLTATRHFNLQTMQPMLIFLGVIMIGLNFLLDYISDMPEFFLANTTIIMIYLMNSIMGLRYRYSFPIVLLLFPFYLYYATSVSQHEAFHMSQIPNVLNSLGIALLIGFLLERGKRVDYLQRMEMKKQNQLVGEVSEQKNRIISVLSHDLSSPMQNLSALIRLKKEDMMTEEEWVEHIAKIQKSLNGASFLLQNLVRWSKTQMEGFNPVLEQLNMNAMVKETIDTLGTLAQDKGIMVLNQLPEKLFCRADREMIRLVIRNILTNSIKFSNPQSSVEISGYEEKDCVITIKDFGVGMDAEQVEGLFSMPNDSRQGTLYEKGTGIGLMLTRAFVVINQGSINVQSIPGQGSTFTIRLPK